MISSVKALAFSPSSSPSPSSLQRLLAAKWPVKFPRSSFSVKRRRSTRRLRRRSDLDKKLDYSPTTPKTISFDDVTGVNKNKSFRLVLDVNQMSFLASSRFRQLVSSADDAFSDLKTLVSVDNNNRVVFSCRESTLQFTGASLFCGLVLIFAFRILVDLGLRLNRKLGFRGRDVHVVVRRDRSLGGKEVVVTRKVNEREDGKNKNKSNDYFRASDNPLWSLDEVFGSGLRKDDWKAYRGRSQAKLPKWWSESVAAERNLVVDKQEYQREANRLMRAITDNRTSGKDITDIDIIQLHQICRTSGVQVTFDTTNTRDAFYRASIDLILNVCSRAPSYSALVQIDGEDAQQFVCGLAKSIGLENVRAARMVSAAVAARTRSCFLQAWALEVQGRHPEAVLELSKICPILDTFPPEESSPEMEMVARGLSKHLKVEQREFLMNMFVTVCKEECHRSAADALGLTTFSQFVGDLKNGGHT